MSGRFPRNTLTLQQVTFKYICVYYILYFDFSFDFFNDDLYIKAKICGYKKRVKNVLFEFQIFKS